MNKNKLKQLIGLSALLITLTLKAQALTGLVNLAWDYPIAELNTSLTFKLYSTTNNGTTWSLFKTIVGTNLTTQIQLPSISPPYGLALSASNSLGESLKSNVLIVDFFLPTLPPKIPTNLRIISSQ